MLRGEEEGEMLKISKICSDIINQVVEIVVEIFSDKKGMKSILRSFFLLLRWLLPQTSSRK